MLYRETVEFSTLELLRRLLSLEPFKDFALAGGTALALQYGHRISVDLDLFIGSSFNTEEALQSIKEAKPSYQIIGQGKNTLNLVIEGVKVDFLSHQYPQLSEQIDLDGIRFMSVKDIAAMKLSAMAQRGSKKDFFDVDELLKHFSLRELISFYSMKYNEQNLFYLLKSLTYFQDAEVEPDPKVLNGVSWGDVKSNLIRAANSYI
uniref:nucleotidyl transferase AbiEii/AbiGii toxin family protein n=2 Tax=Roseivirga sp. TaxID=1964215 RepID=UPI004048E5C0